MKKFKVVVKETLVRFVEIEAETPEDAVIKIEADYKQEKIVLDSGDYSHTDFYVEETKNGE